MHDSFQRLVYLLWLYLLWLYLLWQAAVMHDSFQRLRQRLRGDTQIFPGHEYTEMLLSMAVKNEPMNAAARRCLRSAQVTLSQTLTLTLT